MANEENIALKKMVLQQGALVEEAIEKAIRAFLTRDAELARTVIGQDEEIDRSEIAVEEECVRIMALKRPIASDLRFVVAILKLNNDLERMGDIAANIARRAKFLARREPVDFPIQLENMGREVRDMVRQSLDALVYRDLDVARAVCVKDDEVSSMKGQLKRQIRELMMEEPEMIHSYLKLMDVPRHLGRIAELSSKIAKDVIYLISGEIVRHRGPEFFDDEDEGIPTAYQPADQSRE